MQISRKGKNTPSTPGAVSCDMQNRNQRRSEMPKVMSRVFVIKIMQSKAIGFQNKDPGCPAYN